MKRILGDFMLPRKPLMWTDGAGFKLDGADGEKKGQSFVESWSLGVPVMAARRPDAECGPHLAGSTRCHCGRDGHP